MPHLRRLSGPLLLLALLWPAAGLAAPDDDDDLDELQAPIIRNEWVAARNDRRHDIRTWIKQEDGKRYRSFKVEASLNSSMRSLVRTLLDVRNYDKWYWEVIDAQLLRQLSPTEYQIYLKHRAPHGFPDRDVPAILSFEPQTGNNPTLVLRVRAVPDLLPVKKGYIRMEAEDMIIHLTPVGRREVRIVAEGYVDPGRGRVPGWAINYIQRSAPYSIVLGLKRYLKTSEPDLRGPLPFPVREYGE